MAVKARQATIFVLTLAFAAIVVTSPAGAHTEFVSSNPADGSTLATVVDEVVLTFSTAVEPTGEGFVALDGSGDLRQPDAVVSNIERTTWTLTFGPPLDAGVVGVRWTVSAGDSHRLVGMFSFTVNAFNTTTTTLPAIESSPASPEAVPSEDPVPAQATELIDRPTIQSRSVTLVDSLQPQEPIAIAVPIAAIGRLLTLAGTALAIGVVTFSMATQARRQSEIRIVNTLTRLGALAVMIGSLAVFGGHVAITANGWDSVTIGTVQEELSSGLGFAVIMRLMAATLFLWWTLTQSRSIVLTAPISAPVPALVASGARSAGQTHRSAGPPDRAGNQHNNTHIDHTYEGHLRWGGTLTTGTAFLLASFTLDGHTFTEGNHLLTSAATVAHVAAGSVWAGGVVALAAILLSRRRQGNPLDAVDLVVRFSTLAGPALAAAGAAGVALTVIILNELSQLWTTPWGQILLVKTIAVGMAAMIGAYNHLVLVPALDQRGGADRSRSDSAAARVRSTITAEALLMIPIITLTAFLVVASSRV